MKMRLFVQHFLFQIVVNFFLFEPISSTTNQLKIQRRREKINFRKNRDLQIAEKANQRQKFLKKFQQKKVESLVQKAGFYEQGSRCLPELDFTYSASEFEASEQILDSFVENGLFNVKGFKGNLFFTRIPEEYRGDFYLIAYGSLDRKNALYRVVAGDGILDSDDSGISIEQSKFKKYKKTAFKLTFDDRVWLDSDGKMSLEIAHFAESDGSFINWYYCYRQQKAEVVDRMVETMVPSTTTTATTTTTTTTEQTTSTAELITSEIINPTTKLTTKVTPAPVYGTPQTADIVFVIEGSNQVGESNFRKIMTFVQNFAEKLQVTPGKDRVALITYSDSVVANFYFIDKKRKLTRLLSKTQFPGGEGAFPGATMLLAKRYIFDSFGRENSSKFMFHIPHSVSSDTLDELYAEQIRNIEEIEIITIGVADETYKELKDELHALHKGREGSVFMTRSFDRLDGYVNYLADIVRGRLRV